MELIYVGLDHRCVDDTRPDIDWSYRWTQQYENKQTDRYTELIHHGWHVTWPNVTWRAAGINSTATVYLASGLMSLCEWQVECWSRRWVNLYTADSTWELCVRVVYARCTLVKQRTCLSVRLSRCQPLFNVLINIMIVMTMIISDWTRSRTRYARYDPPSLTCLVPTTSSNITNMLRLCLDEVYIHVNSAASMCDGSR